MSQSLDQGNSNSRPLSTTSARLVAVKIKSANKNIFRALLSLASANLLIRLMGLLNQIIVTAKFGQGANMDAYYIAVLIPTTVAPLIASAMESSVIPIYAGIRTRRGRAQASRLFSTLLNLLLIVGALLTIGSIAWSHYLLYLVAPGEQPSTLMIANSFAPLTMPLLSLMTFNSFMECLLNTEGKFGWPAYAGIFVPLTAVVFVYFGGNSLGTVMLCLGTLVGQFVQFGAIVYRAHKARMIYKPVIDLRMPELKPLFAAAWPAFCGGLIGMASPIIDNFFGSFQPAGTISALSNALKLNSVPTGVLFAAVGRAALPYLANQASINDMRAFKGTLRLYLWVVGIATLILTVVMTLGSHLIVQLAFQRHNFTAHDTDSTAVILAGFTVGMFPMAIGFIASHAFSALGRTRVLMWVSTFTLFANALFDAVFGHYLGGAGIALATSLYYFCTMFILLIVLTRTIGPLHLLTPPPELLDILRKVSMGDYFANHTGGSGSSLHNLGFTYAFRKKFSQIAFALIVFIGGVAGSISNASYTVRVAFGSIIILALLRYQYILLLCWACINVFIGSALPLFNGANLLSALTVPTLLLLFYLPTKDAFKRMPALVFWLLYFLWMLPGIAFAPIPISQFIIIWLQLLDFVGVSVLVIILVTDRKRMLLLIDMMLVPAIFIAFYGFYGFVIKQHGVIDTSTGYFRISSIFYDTPPTLGLYLSVIIPLAIYRVFTLRGFWKISLGVVLTLIFMLALAMTFNRGTLIAVGAGLAISILFLPSWKMRGIGIGGGIALAGLVILGASAAGIPVLARFANSDISSLNGRTYLWQALLSHFDPGQLLGNGLKSSDVLLTNLKVGFNGYVIAAAAHNIYLESLYETGVIGLSLMVLAFLITGLILLRRYASGNFELRLFLAAAIGTFVSFLIQGYESNDMWNQEVGMYFFILLALGFCRYWDTTKQKARQTKLQAEELHVTDSRDVDILPEKEDPLTAAPYRV
ncbi:O-antigen ligase family protein [Ktedonobacteria bacterium brp13]|nr:O-antigen ligase family protein [Ktedonobacteria bacterium brp13]